MLFSQYTFSGAEKKGSTKTSIHGFHFQNSSKDTIHLEFPVATQTKKNSFIGTFPASLLCSTKANVDEKHTVGMAWLQGRRLQTHISKQDTFFLFIYKVVLE